MVVFQSRDRKVVFVPEVEDEPDKNNRLRRRDTPHYLKNKRVNNKEEDAEQKVREILAQAAAQKEAAAVSPVVKVTKITVKFLRRFLILSDHVFYVICNTDIRLFYVISHFFQNGYNKVPSHPKLTGWYSPGA